MKIALAGYCGVGLVFSLAVLGCGGGGGAGGGSSTGTGTTSVSAQTKADLTNLTSAMGQGIASMSFRSFGPKLQTAHQAFYDSILGLYGVVSASPAGVIENFYQDQTATTPAGGLNYTAVDATFTTGGSISVTSGKFAGLTGTYKSQLVITGTSKGYQGSCSYTVPKVSSVSNQFTLTILDTGSTSGTATASAVLQNNYVQTEQFTFNSDSSYAVVTPKDAAGLTSTLNFNADNSGSGTVQGSDKGLPAKIQWDTSGTGTITLATNQVLQMTNWTVSS